MSDETSFIPVPPTPPAPPTPPTPSTQGGQSTQGDDSGLIIPDFVQSEYPELVTLIQRTESMDLDEKNYWLQIIPVMTEAQIDQLRTILTDEAKQLALLDQEYQQELSKLNENHASQWNAQEAMQAKAALKKAEEAAKKEEEAVEADILNQLDNV